MYFIVLEKGIFFRPFFGINPTILLRTASCFSAAATSQIFPAKLGRVPAGRVLRARARATGRDLRLNLARAQIMTCVAGCLDKSD
jgi:hypothetical protein